MIQFVRNQMTVQANQSGIGSVGAFWNLLTGKQSGTIAAAGYLVLAVAGCALAQDLWKKVFLLSSIMVVAPLWSGRYTTIYMIIPLILFLEKAVRKELIIYMRYSLPVYSCLLCIIPRGHWTVFIQTFHTQLNECQYIS